MGLVGSRYGKTPKRFLMVMRWCENLSSGEKRATIEEERRVSERVKEISDDVLAHRDVQTSSFLRHR